MEKTLEINFINCEISSILAWSENYVIIYTDVENQNATFSITKTPLSTQDNAKSLQQLKSGKYVSKLELLEENPNLNHLVEPSFQGVNIIFNFQGLALR